jgi:hypothetical protein
MFNRLGIEIATSDYNGSYDVDTMADLLAIIGSLDYGKDSE